MICKASIIIAALCCLTNSAPVEEPGCKIPEFKSTIFNESLLLDNRFVCPEGKDKLGADGFCQHLYKCPLDFSNKVRHCEAVCRGDGTWDYKYPTCEDMLPLAEYLEAQVMISVTTEKLNQKRNKQMPKPYMTADAIIDVLKENHLDADGTEDGTKADDKTPSRVRRWLGLFVKPPPRMAITATSEEPDTTEEPATTAIATTTTTTTTVKTTTRPRGHIGWLRQFCIAPICAIANQGGCGKIDSRMADHAVQMKVCQICVMINECSTKVDTFGTRG